MVLHSMRYSKAEIGVWSEAIGQGARVVSVSGLQLQASACVMVRGGTYRISSLRGWMGREAPKGVREATSRSQVAEESRHGFRGGQQAWNGQGPAVELSA